MVDRLAEIEKQWAMYPYLHDPVDHEWLIAEVKRLRAMIESEGITWREL